MIFHGNTIGGPGTSPLGEPFPREYDAVFIASGANSGARISSGRHRQERIPLGLGIPPRTSPAVRRPTLGRNVVVIGGGNVALDVALTVKRLGAKTVTIVCLEARNEMPAHPWEIALAEEEGCG